MSAAYTLKPCSMQTTGISICFRNKNSDTFGTKYTYALDIYSHKNQNKKYRKSQLIKEW